MRKLKATCHISFVCIAATNTGRIRHQGAIMKECVLDIIRDYEERSRRSVGHLRVDKIQDRKIDMYLCWLFIVSSY